MTKVNMNEEVWLPVAGYEGLYEVSNYGRVKSVERKARYIHKNGDEHYRRVDERIMSQNVHYRQKRKTVMLCKNNKPRRISVHRLVAIAFCDNPNNYSEINHIDENPLNNRADNLEWCTRSYNMHYGTIQERVYDKKKRAIVAYNEDGDMIRFDSLKAAEDVGIKRYRINYAIKNGTLLDGYYWRYDDGEQ